MKAEAFNAEKRRARKTRRDHQDGFLGLSPFTLRPHGLPPLLRVEIPHA